LGALVGWQRQHAGQEAGIRTFAALALGACVFRLLDVPDTRIAPQVVSGIGFLGAGVIIRGRTHIHGLTTAAALWATASIGMAVGYGRFVTGVVVAIILVALLSIPTRKSQKEIEPRDSSGAVTGTSVASSFGKPLAIARQKGRR
jgi:putative Mg2+ transporter-C (MgtC) family protein